MHRPESDPDERRPEAHACIAEIARRDPNGMVGRKTRAVFRPTRFFSADVPHPWAVRRPAAFPANRIFPRMERVSFTSIK